MIEFRGAMNRAGRSARLRDVCRRIWRGWQTWALSALLVAIASAVGSSLFLCDSWQFQAVIGRQMVEWGHPARREQALRKAVERADSAHTEGLPLAAALADLASLLSETGRHDEAEALFGRALSIQKDRLGPDHPDVSDTLYDLASTYLARGWYAGAEPMYVESLRIRESALGTRDSVVAGTLAQIGLIQAMTGRVAEADHSLLRALEIAKAELGPIDLRIARILNALAVLRVIQGRQEDADRLLERSLDVANRAVPARYPAVEWVLDGIETLRGPLGGFAGIDGFVGRSIRSMRRINHPPHELVAEILNNIGVSRFRSGDLAAAEQNMTEARAIIRRIGSRHALEAKVLFNLGRVYAAQERVDDAKDVLEAASALTHDRFRRGDPTSRRIRAYADLLQRAGS